MKTVLIHLATFAAAFVVITGALATVLIWHDNLQCGDPYHRQTAATGEP